MGGPRSRRIVRIVIRAIVTLLMVGVLNFVLFRIIPGDPAKLLLGGARSSVTAEQMQALRQNWGLDRPLFPDQVIDYLSATIQGDLGYSFKFRGRHVADLILERLPATIALVGLAQLIAIPWGVMLGLYAGWRRGGAVDHIATATSLALYSTPSFWLGMLLVVVFSTALGWFPGYGAYSPGAITGSLGSFLDYLLHLTLPVTAVALGLIGQYVVVARAAMSDVVTEDYMVTARAKGLTNRQMLMRHAFRNAMLPVVTLIALNLGYVVAGAITIEAVFAWPGIGGLTVEALNARDYPVLQGIFLLLGASIVVANLVADLAYGFLDPRVRQ
ncbi:MULTISPECIES: ABC transporter permease [unclassified Mesorhizobium]|uniref:ABC transporter permease n=1 Tax=unclassified Mesorhizobium TaxID=325217 RepID=UPI000FC9A312|nr:MULTISPECIES: ABC transporter permease [unclassified Mesorhizobium]RUX03905.1 ABC transporter permease [Mesorhizobium sp. M8A.F.Ca.ET.023.01.1.1]RVD51018.1 ABC transporter permease [Mesorhizobium sp. M8A.F.Ca.ET.023.02.2.1]TGR36945.1 ABC transporter permease [bacterium M00.F.Ca.ET.199.01.1.1]TGU17902.1 ABC transporter permease [bacterium M00.F.Ca.ET.156.01.1.1]TGV82121.1 ABC transporter permease [Mesorhizobium sp. M00.F.Ca.ET.149.01.1.1]